jgi:hypothetical protein
MQREQPREQGAVTQPGKKNSRLLHLCLNPNVNKRERTITQFLVTACSTTNAKRYAMNHLHNIPLEYYLQKNLN